MKRPRLRSPRRGLGVDAAEEGDVDASEQAGDGLVGLDHEHLDERVGEAGVFGLGVDDVAVVVEDQLDLGQVEDDHALIEATLADDLCEGVHLFEEVDDFAGDAFLVAVDDCLGLGVGKPLGGADDRVGEAGPEDVTVGVVLDERALAAGGSPSCSEQTPLESTSGSMGMTWPGK